MKPSFSFVIALSLFFVTCKKKDTTTDTPDTTPAPTATPKVFYGILTTGNTSFNSGGIDISSFSSSASFSNKAVSYYQQASAIYAGRVLLNSDSLAYYSSGGGTSAGGQYIGSSTTTPASDVWDVAGGNGIPHFTYTNTAAYPSYEVVGSIPNTFAKSKGVTLTINNVSNIAQGSLLLSDGTTNVKGTFIANLKEGNNTITISSANMAAMATTTSAIVSIYADNSKVANFSGKDFQFVHQMSSLKTITITP